MEEILPGVGVLQDQTSPIADRLVAIQRLTDAITCSQVKKKAFVWNNGPAILLDLLGTPGITVDSAMADGPPTLWTDARELARRTLVLMRIVCRAGFHLIAPIISKQLPQGVMVLADIDTNHSRLVCEALQTLIVLFQPLLFEEREPVSPGMSFDQAKEAVFSAEPIRLLGKILSQTTPRRIVFQQQNAVLTLLQFCTDLEYRLNAISSGVVDMLASRLAVFVYDSRCPLPEKAQFPDRKEWPLVSKFQFEPLFDALAAIVGHSPYILVRLFNNPYLRQIFPVTDSGLPQVGNLVKDPGEITSKKFQWASTGFQHPIDSLVSATFNLENSQDVPRHTVTMTGRPAKLVPKLCHLPRMASPTFEFQNPLIVWLIYTSRAKVGLERLAVMRFLTRVVSATMLCSALRKNMPLDPSNRQQFLSTLVPSLVSMCSRALTQLKFGAPTETERLKQRLILQSTPMILYELATCGCGAEKISQSAFNSDVADVIRRILDYSLVRATVDEERFCFHVMSPTRDSDKMDEDVDSEDDDILLGPNDMPTEELHKFQCRAGAFYALAAITQTADCYRSSPFRLIPGLLSHLLDSIDHTRGAVPAEPASKSQPTTISELIGNGSKALGTYNHPSYVRIAACEALKCISRSVQLIKSVLNDSQVISALFQMLNDPSYAIRTSGTEVCCNFALPYAATRAHFTDSNRVIRQICQNARIDDYELSHASLWLLKNLSNQTNCMVKIEVLGVLGADGWMLKQLTNSWPVVVPPELMSDTDLPSISGLASISPADFAVKLSADSTFNETARAATEAFFLKEEILCLIRNLIGEPEEPSFTMVERVFDVFGMKDLMDAIAIILRDSVTMPWVFKRSQPAGLKNAPPREMYNLYATPLALFHPDKPRSFVDMKLPNPSLLIHAAVMCLVHIAGSGDEYQRLLLDATLPPSVELLGPKEASKVGFLIEQPTLTPAPSSPMDNGDVGDGRAAKHAHVGLNAAKSVVPGAVPALANRSIPRLGKPSDGSVSDDSDKKTCSDPPTSPPAVDETNKGRLLSLITPLFAHPDVSVRTGCCWLYQNLLWETKSDPTRFVGRGERALELRELGWETVIRRLDKEQSVDCVQNIRVIKNVC